MGNLFCPSTEAESCKRENEIVNVPIETSIKPPNSFGVIDNGETTPASDPPSAANRGIDLRNIPVRDVDRQIEPSKIDPQSKEKQENQTDEGEANGEIGPIPNIQVDNGTTVHVDSNIDNGKAEKSEWEGVLFGEEVGTVEPQDGDHDGSNSVQQFSSPSVDAAETTPQPSLGQRETDANAGAKTEITKEELANLVIDLVTQSETPITLDNLKLKLKEKHGVQMKMKARKMVDSISELLIVEHEGIFEVRTKSEKREEKPLLPSSSDISTESALTPSEVKAMAVELVAKSEKAITVNDFRASFKQCFSRSVPQRIRITKLLNTSKQLQLVEVEHEGATTTVIKLAETKEQAPSRDYEEEAGDNTSQLSLRELIELVVNLVSTSEEPVTTQNLKKFLKEKHGIDMKMKVKKLLTSASKQLKVVDEKLYLVDEEGENQMLNMNTEDLPKHESVIKMKEALVSKLTADNCADLDTGISSADLQKQIAARLEKLRWKRPDGVSRRDFSAAITTAILTDDRVASGEDSGAVMKVWVKQLGQ